MPDSYIFDSPEHAAKVLGHELAHCIFEQSGKESHDEQTCDELGDSLYNYAVMVAGNKAASIWK